MNSTTTVSRSTRLRTWVSADVTGGALMIGAAVVGFAWANSPWQDAYFALAGTAVGPQALHLDLTLATWAADGLLAIFFFVVGVELKHEVVAGSLRDPRTAAVPVFAAVGGMVTPALLYLLIVGIAAPGPALQGWAIPTATDIAFALAVLAIFGRGLPSALRVFLLTLAVVDDLLAIVVIAVFYTDDVSLLFLVAAAAVVALFAVVVRMKRMHWWMLVPLAVVAWALMHESGVHATIAGVALGLVVPAKAMRGEAGSRAVQLEHSIRPISSGIALPIFAFFAAGVSVAQEGGIVESLLDPVAIAIIVALVVGKLVGVLGVTAIVTRFTRLRLPDSIGIRDLLPIGLLTGIGFTVALLVAELSFDDGHHDEIAKLAVLVASVIAAVLAAVTLRMDARKTRSADMNQDGVPDPAGDHIGDPPRP